ncbi:hypothetical protein KY285_020208 [Solanum tuberosum]|nr:hypothetical protein KY285_020208 [Solanum tuberosum]
MVHSTDRETICDPFQYTISHSQVTNWCSRGSSLTVVPTTARLGSHWVRAFLRQGVTLYYGSPKKEHNQTFLPHCFSISPDKREILQDTHPQSKEEGSSSGSREESGSQFDAGLGIQSVDGSGGSSESASGSQEDTTTPPSAVNTEAETGAQEKAGVVGEYEDITNDDTMVLYVNINEVDPAKRQQLIDCFPFMWTVNRSEEFFNNGIVNNSGGFKKRSIMPETRVVVADIKSIPDIYWIFQFHQFDWMNNAPGEYSSHLTREFYLSYEATLMNFVADTETTKRWQKEIAKYTAPASIDLFEGKHHAVTSDTKMEVQSSRERVLSWIASEIALDRENAVWVTATPTLITKASLFLQPSYPVNMGRIIATEMRDRALNERVGLLFPYLIGKLSRQANIPPNRLVGRWAVGSLVVVPHAPIDIPHEDRGPDQGESSQPSIEAPPPPTSASQAPDQCQNRTLVDQIVHRTPQLIDRDVLTVEKKIKDEMRKELAAAGSVNTEDFQTQLAKMRAQVAKLAEKPVQVPTPIMPKSLLQLLSQAPSTQSLDNFWGELPKSKSGKRKHKAVESNEELPANLSREERRQHKKAHRASRKEAREKDT